jgi:hypothetical protein
MLGRGDRWFAAREGAANRDEAGSGCIGLSDDVTAQPRYPRQQSFVLENLECSSASPPSPSSLICQTGNRRY